MIEGRGIREIRALYEAARQDLRDRLLSLKKAGKDQTFTAHHSRMVLLQLEEALADFAQPMASRMAASTNDAQRLGIEALAAEIHALEPEFEMAGVPLAVEEAAVFEGLVRDERPIIRRRLDEDVGRYSAVTVKKVERTMALGLVEGASVGEMIDAVSDSDGVFAGNRYWAERIVRTEMANAYEVTKLGAMRETERTDLPGMKRQIVMVKDDRTGEDSKMINGQVVGMDEPFKDPLGPSEGRPATFMHPPNRPNDRETVVPFHPDWGTAMKKRMARSLTRN